MQPDHDGAHILRYIFAHFAVTARGGLYQLAALIAQIIGKAVEFEFAGIFDLVRFLKALRTRESKVIAPVDSMSVSVQMESMGTA